MFYEERNAMSITTTTWNKSSWRDFPIKQHPIYTDKSAIESVEKELSGLPPLVFAKEADSLKEKFAKASRGEAFVLQGGRLCGEFLTI